MNLHEMGRYSGQFPVRIRISQHCHLVGEQSPNRSNIQAIVEQACRLRDIYQLQQNGYRIEIRHYPTSPKVLHCSNSQ